MDNKDIAVRVFEYNASKQIEQAVYYINSLIASAVYLFSLPTLENKLIMHFTEEVYIGELYIYIYIYIYLFICIYIYIYTNYLLG